MKLYTFSYSPSLEYTLEGKIATLQKDITIDLYTDEGHYRIKAEKGFKWNGNSGAFPCRFHKTNEKYNVIILVHDILYHRIGLSKADADDILRGGLREAGYGRVMAGTIHKAVQLGARYAYWSDDAMTLDNIDLISLEIIDC